MLKNNEISQCLMYIVQVHDFRHVNKYKLCIFSHPDRSAESMPVFPSFFSKNWIRETVFSMRWVFFPPHSLGFFTYRKHTFRYRIRIYSEYLISTCRLLLEMS